MAQEQLNKMSLALRATAMLVWYWSLPAAAEQRKAKVESLHGAVARGVGVGKPEAWPHEIVESEYRLALEAVRWVRRAFPRIFPHDLCNALCNTEVGYTVSEQTDQPYIIRRLYPVSHASLAKFATDVAAKHVKPSEVAHKLVSWRLGIGTKTVENAIGRKQPRVVTLTRPQSLLLTFAIDLLSMEREPADDELLAEALDTLLASGCPALVIYYLIRCSNRLTELSALGEPDPCVVRDLCKRIVRPGIWGDRGPFRRLLSGQ